MDRAYVVWGDAFGATRTVYYSFLTGSLLAPWSAAAVAVVNPTPLQVTAATVQTPGGAPSTNPYPNVSDAAVLSFLSAGGNIIGVTLPGFKEALYLADNQTVDPAQPLVIAFVAQCLGFLVDTFGNPATTFLGGIRQKRG